MSITLIAVIVFFYVVTVFTFKVPSSGYQTAWYCEKCKAEMSDNQRCYNSGRCPHCGWKGESACTIADTIEKAYTWERNRRPFWHIFIPGVQVYYRVFKEEEK